MAASEWTTLEHCCGESHVQVSERLSIWAEIWRTDTGYTGLAYTFWESDSQAIPNQRLWEADGEDEDALMTQAAEVLDQWEAPLAGGGREAREA